MTPARFRECLHQIRWTSTDIVNALQCDVFLIDGIECGDVDVPPDIAAWLEKLAGYHQANPPLLTRWRCSPPKRAGGNRHFWPDTDITANSRDFSRGKGIGGLYAQAAPGDVHTPCSRFK